MHSFTFIQRQKRMKRKNLTTFESLSIRHFQICHLEIKASMIPYLKETHCDILMEIALNTSHKKYHMIALNASSLLDEIRRNSKKFKKKKLNFQLL